MRRALLCTSLGVDAHEIRTGPAIVMPNPVVETVDGHVGVVFPLPWPVHFGTTGARVNACPLPSSQRPALMPRCRRL